MAFTTIEGPLRVGPTRYTNPASGGLQADVGLVRLAQSFTIPFASITTAPAAVALFTVPAGTKLVDLDVEVLGSLGNATNCGNVVGNSTVANQFWTSFNSGNTAVRVSPATIAAQQQVANTDNVGTSQVTVYATATAAGANASSGSVKLTIEYIQRNPDGSTAPGTTWVLNSGTTGDQLP